MKTRDEAEQLPLSEVDNLIPAFTRGGDGALNLEDYIIAYLQEIAKTPLLTSVEESKLFKQFSASLQGIEELLIKLPLQILDDVQSQSVLRRGNKTKYLNGRWWSPMEIRVILERISTAFETSQNGRTEASPGEKNAIQTIQNQLAAAVSAMEAVREQIVCANLLLVASIVMQYRCYTPSLSLMDLMQEGSIGLMKAVEKFDLQRGCKFSTYAYWWIRQRVQRALAQQSHTIRIPCYLSAVRQSITDTQRRLTRQLEREPSIREIALAVGVDESRALEVLQSAKGVISLASPFFDSADTTLSDMLADKSHATPDLELLCLSNKESLEMVLDTLTSRQKTVIQLRYGLTDGTEYTLAQIGQHLGISRERVRQIQQEALAKLRHPTRCQPLKELL